MSKKLSRMKPLVHPRLLPWLLAAGLAVHTAARGEADPDDSRLKLSGFGTVGAARLSAGDVALTLPGRVTGLRDEWTLGLDSKAALQARYRLLPAVTATLQVLSRQGVEGGYRPEVEWAFLRWDVNPALSLRAGRMAGPVFINSDVRDVNYALLTARAPIDVYNQVPVRHYDGVDATYRVEVGEASVAASVWGGRAAARYRALSTTGETTDSRMVLDDILGVNLVASLDEGWTLRAGHSRSRASTVLRGSTPAVALPPAVDALIHQTFDTQDEPIAFTAVGASYDRGRWLFNAEYTLRRGDSPIADTAGWYVNAGYRLGAFIPYAGLSALRVVAHNRRNPFAAFLGQPGLMGAVADSVQWNLNALVWTQRTVTGGLRWNVNDRVALKVQWDRITKPAGAFGSFYVPQGAASPQGRALFEARRRVDLMSLSVDFVF